MRPCPSQQIFGANLSPPEGQALERRREEIALPHVSPFMLAGAWAILLGRYSGSDQVEFGILRSHSEVLPLRLQIPEDRLVSGFFEEIAGALDTLAFPSNAPFFETAIDFSGGNGDSHADLPLLLRPGNAPSRLIADYDAHRFADGAVSRILGQLKHLIENALANPDQPVSALPLMSPGELRDLLTRFNATAADYPADCSIHELFQAQARRSPDRTAVIFEDRAVTYRELDQKSNRIAAKLVALDAEPDSIIAICAERSLEMMAGLLGILKSGAAYLPLDPSFPPERLEFMLRDSRAPILVTQKHLSARFPATPAHVVTIGPEDESESREFIPSISSTSQNLAYAIYTSGSTGTPKGVLIEHRQVLNFFAGMDRVIGPDPGVWLAVTSISFDISVLELFWTLARGFTVVLQPESEKLASGGQYSIAAQIARHHVTHFQCTPSLARLLAADPDSARALRTIPNLMLGGEALTPALVSQLGLEPPSRLLNLYGPTETTIWSASYRVTGNENVIPIGRPIANTQLYILDRNLQPVPFGANGELFIGGDGVCRGYLNRPELTAEKFIANPFPSMPGARIYRTGDLARYRPDGEVEFLGRADNQVKIMGFRIEPEEIEAVLSLHPAVRAAAVIPREDVPGEKTLAAYVLPTAAGAARVNELRAYLQRHLPPHMAPSAFVFLDSMPSTPNGKIDRKALANIRPARSAPASSPRTPAEIETMLSAIWREALDTDSVGLHDNFFDLGATSLSIAEVSIQLAGMLGQNVPLTDLFQYPTIGALARHLAGQSDDFPATQAVTRGESRKAAFLARTQTRS